MLNNMILMCEMQIGPPADVPARLQQVVSDLSANRVEDLEKHVSPVPKEAVGAAYTATKNLMDLQGIEWRQGGIGGLQKVVVRATGKAVFVCDNHACDSKYSSRMNASASVSSSVAVAVAIASPTSGTQTSASAGNFRSPPAPSFAVTPALSLSTTQLGESV